MNHDYSHCLDYTEACPKDCFRAELVMDLRKRIVEFANIPMTWTHFIDTDECMLRKTEMDDREFMEWFVDALVTSDLYWDTERRELIDEAVDKLIQAGKVIQVSTGRYERVT